MSNSRIGSPSARRQFLFAPLLCLCLVTSHSVAQRDAAGKHAHPAPGTSIIRFAGIDEDVYKGSRPKSDADYSFLRSKNVKTIIDIDFVPFLYHFEKKKARKYGMEVIPVTINASPISPSEKHVRRILCMLNNKQLRPIYFHCDLGRDRSSLIAVLYEIYFRGLPPEKAMQEMKAFGFDDEWTLHGLKRYLEKHANSGFTPATACAHDGHRSAASAARQ